MEGEQQADLSFYIYWLLNDSVFTQIHMDLFWRSWKIISVHILSQWSRNLCTGADINEDTRGATVTTSWVFALCVGAQRPHVWQTYRQKHTVSRAPCVVLQCVTGGAHSCQTRQGEEYKHLDWHSVEERASELRAKHSGTCPTALEEVTTHNTPMGLWKWK